MVGRIEDYALIGDTHTAALVGRDGSIDWLCVPRFDSGAVFAALLGRPDDHGRWLLAPAGGIQRIERQYRPNTLVLETTFHTDTGVARLIDCMPIRKRAVELVRVVECVSGRVPMQMDARFRFEYGSALPWVVERDGRLHATAGPNTVVLTTPVAVEGAGHSSVAVVRRRRRRTSPVRADVASFARACATPDRCRAGGADDDELVATVVPALRVRRRRQLSS